MYIYWGDGSKTNEKGEVFANVHLLVGYTPDTIEAFQKMADKLRKTFPQASDSEISCGKVKQSPSVRDFSIITWGAYLPKSDYPGWYQIPNGQPPYFW